MHRLPACTQGAFQTGHPQHLTQAVYQHGGVGLADTEIGDPGILCQAVRFT